MFKLKGWKISSLLILAVSIFLSIALVGCSSNASKSFSPLSSANINLIFVVTQDLAHNAGDIDPSTANLNNQGLQRVIGLASYLHTTLLGGANVNGIYALEPMTHLQTTNNYPDLVPLETAEQFAVLNQYSITSKLPPVTTVTANSFPVNACYTSASIPAGVSTPSAFYAECQGIDYANSGGDNESLAMSIIAQGQGGFYVFALPFEPFQALLTNLKTRNSYSYTVPTTWEGANTVYVLTIDPTNPSQGLPALTSYNTQIKPATTYPTPVPAPQSAACGAQTPFEINTSTIAGSSLPGGINASETVYFVRHGEAHPASFWEDGNLVYPGNVRALYLPTALEGKINSPDLVYAVDPSQFIPSDVESRMFSYVRTSQTVAPYVIANGIPFNVASGFQWGGNSSLDDAAAVEAAVSFFFTGGQFTGKTLLISWEHNHIPRIAQALVNKYFTSGVPPPIVPPSSSWPGTDYDTIWTFTLDGSGNLTLNNYNCEGISSNSLPLMP